MVAIGEAPDMLPYVFVELALDTWKTLVPDNGDST